MNIILGSQCSLGSDASDGGTQHLALALFDILHLDPGPLTGPPYYERRNVTESIVLSIPGPSMLSERSPTDSTKSIDIASAQMRYALAQELAGHQGLVLRADEGAYIKHPWVKVHI